VAAFDTIPIVDLAPWNTGAAGKRSVARAIGAACREVGFFYATGHGVDPRLRGQVLKAAHRFFDLPRTAKEAVRGHHRGYIPTRGEATDPLAAPDLKEAFDVGLVLDAPRDTPGFERMTSPNRWPDLPGFQEPVEAYFAAMLALARRLSAMFSLALGMPEGHFAAQLTRPIAQLRLLRYPVARAEDTAPGIGTHCDYECFTILAQDGVGGLEVRNTAGAWVAAPPLEDTFVVNIGELLQRWTNDLFRATPHRVVAVAGAPRYSIPFFFATNYDTEIACLPSCTTAENPPRYPPVAAGRYLEDRLREIYG
jgi:isopenicillin N synthase-like dioxygenase